MQGNGAKGRSLRSSTSVIEEVLADGLVAAVGRGKGAIEVRQQVDLLAGGGALGQDTGDSGVAGVGV